MRVGGRIFFIDFFQSSFITCFECEQGKKVKRKRKKKNLFFLLFLNFFSSFLLEKLIKVSRVTRVGRVTPIKPFFILGLSTRVVNGIHNNCAKLSVLPCCKYRETVGILIGWRRDRRSHTELIQFESIEQHRSVYWEWKT